ncbi:hypothetical protein [Nonomuraea sp. NPDC001023]|uniref:hypothetical protein n=1 Tax=unclassified Nonomuraea TaxID=2593643 RepID=UPI00332460B4
MRAAPWMILIGPAAAGKSTLGAGMAAATGRSFVDLDAIGAGYSHYTRPELFVRVRAALAAVEHVVLVLPCADEGRSVEVLRARSLAAKNTDWISADGHDFLAEWVRAPGNRTLATTVLHTDGELPAQTLARLLTTCGTN